MEYGCNVGRGGHDVSVEMVWSGVCEGEMVEKSKEFESGICDLYSKK